MAYGNTMCMHDTSIVDAVHSVLNLRDQYSRPQYGLDGPIVYTKHNSDPVGNAYVSPVTLPLFGNNIFDDLHSMPYPW